MVSTFLWKAVLSTKPVLGSPRSTGLTVAQRKAQALHNKPRYQQGPAMMEEGATA